MRLIRLATSATWAIAAALLLSAPVGAQQDRNPVAEGNNWSITNSDCGIDAAWEGDVAILLTRHEDHHDLGVYDPRFTGMSNGKVVDVRLGTGGPPAEAQDYRASTYRDKASRSYVMAVGDEFLDAAAASNILQLYRGSALLADLDVTGLTGALAAMRTCEAALPAPEPGTMSEMVETGLAPE
jgi:hypothetical protein